MISLDPIWHHIFLQMVSNPDRFNNYLVLGYFAMWLIGVVYVISLIARQRNLQQDLALMKRLLKDDKSEQDS